MSATRELDELRKQLETLQRSHDTLLKSLSASNGSFEPSDVPRLRRNATQRGDAVFADTSTLSDDSSDDDDDYFVQDELPSQSFDHEHLREHLRNHNWDEHGREILASLVSDPAKLSKQPHLFHLGPGPAEDRKSIMSDKMDTLSLWKSARRTTQCPKPQKSGTRSE
ncbi:hypothetical protein SLS59_004661 [Nothophoma quercina]|uniref:Uncharacterized protein n=1 Tax=Nothophoma quercina TaxID=749835 RepID=A0ABR3REY4_9PLEO